MISVRHSEHCGPGSLAVRALIPALLSTDHITSHITGSGRNEILLDNNSADLMGDSCEVYMT